MKKRMAFLLSGLLSLSIVLTGCSSNSGTSGNKKVTLQFLQNKSEAVGEFNTLIKQFENQNPNIKVKQINPPNADTVLKTDLTKNQLPDVISMGADSTFVEMAKGGVLKDYSGSDALKNVNTKYADMLKKEVGKNGVYGVPYTVNAEPLLYNKALLKKYNMTPPKTWDELISDAQKIKAQGGTPFYFGVKDAWTMMVPWNALAANLQGDNFFSDLKAGKTTFSKSYVEVANRLKKLVSYGEADENGIGYNDANTAFAKGKSVFYVQGNWAIAPILKANPNIDLGAVALPMTNDPSKTKLVSGIDSVLTMPTSTKQKAASQKFINFLLKKENAQAYSDNQKLFSAINGVSQSDKVVAPLQTYIDKGQIADYPDHYYPAAMDANVANMIQGFIVKNTPTSQFLSQLDQVYQK